MNSVDMFEANDLFESGNMTQVHVSLLALAAKAKTKGLQSGVDISIKYSEKQERNFDDATMKASQCITGLQVGTHKCASQSGMMAYGTRRHLYNPKKHILPPMDHSIISLQMGTNRCVSQVGMTAPGIQWHINDTKLGTDKCDNYSISLQIGYMQGASQSGQVFKGLGRQIYEPKHCPQGPVANGAPESAGNYPSLGRPQSTPRPAAKRIQATEALLWGVSLYHYPIQDFRIFCLHLVFLCVQVLPTEGLGRPDPDACGVGGPCQDTSR